MSIRSMTDFPRNEQGLVDNFIGSAYDVVKGVYEALPELGQIYEQIDQIPELAENAVEEAMVPARTEIQTGVAQSEAWAESPTAPDPLDPTSKSAKSWAEEAEQSAIEAAKVNLVFPFLFDSGKSQYDVTEISGRADITTAGMALWVEGAIEYDFLINNSTKFTLLTPTAYPHGAQMRLMVNARFEDMGKNLIELEEAFTLEFEAAQDARELIFDQFMENSDYEVPVAYASGLAITRRTQLVNYLGYNYRVNVAYLPLLTSNWGADSSKMELIGDTKLRDELLEPDGAEIIGFEFNVLSEAIKTAGQFMSRQRRNVWEYAELCPGYVKGGDPLTWDWAPAFNMLNGKAGWVPLGVYPIKSQVTWDLANTDIVMASASGSVIKPAVPFVGDMAVSLGKRTVATVVSSSFVQNFRIDCSDVVGVKGIGIWGLRDGSGLRNIYVRNCEKENFLFGQAGGGVGLATGLMNQGLIIENCHGINQSKSWTSECVFLLDGLFESTLTGCKALGSSLMNNAVKGFGVGLHTEARAVWLNGCSSGNLKHATEANNMGIHYGEWSDSCADIHHTHESVSGLATLFHGGLASGRARPFNCHSISPRLYANTEPGVMDVAYVFGDAGGCSVKPIHYWTSTKKAVQFRTPIVGAAQFNNVAEVNTTVDVDNSGNLSVVEFQAGTAASALVYGIASSTSERKQFRMTPSKTFREHLPNGGQIGGDSFWTTFRAGLSDKIRWQSNAGVNTMELDAAAGTLTPLVRLLLGQNFDSTNKLTLNGYRFWIDTFGRFRSKNGEPTSATDGLPFGQKVAVPSTSSSSGSPGAWAASSTFFYVYTGDGTTHAWVRSALATW